MLSICVTIKNRSKVISNNGPLFLFPKCIESLSKSITINDEVELIIADWESTDWNITDWIEKTISYIPIHIITVKAKGFSVGAGRNIAANNSNGDCIFFMDADMIVNKEVISEGIITTKKGNIYYPTIKYELNGGKQIIHEGGGNVFIPKDIYNKLGGWDQLWSWGFEDILFVEKIKHNGYNITTNDNISIFHQWHPQEKTFKNRFSINEDPVVKNARKHYQKQIDKYPKTVITGIDTFLRENPNTTHSTINPPAKMENGSLHL